MKTRRCPRQWPGKGVSLQEVRWITGMCSCFPVISLNYWLEVLKFFIKAQSSILADTVMYKSRHCFHNRVA